MTTTHQDLAARARRYALELSMIAGPEVYAARNLIIECAAALEAASQPPGAVEQALQDAATSLETISRLAGRKTYGNPPIETYMEHFDEVRGYASSRAAVARAALSAPSPSQAPVVQGEAKRREPMTTAERAALRESLLLGDGMGFHSTVTGVEAFHGIGVKGAT